MQTFICTITKLNGVHSIKITIRHSVFTLIIGKISDVNPIFSIMIATSFVKIGSLRHLSLNIKMGVLIRLHVFYPTDGKNKNITHYSIKQSLAKNSQQLIKSQLRTIAEAIGIKKFVRVVRSVHTFILSMTFVSL